MDVKAVTTGLKAGAALGMTGRLREVLDNYLRYHRIEGSTDDTVRFYSKEIRLFFKDLVPGCETVQDLTPLHVLDHLGSMKDRGLAPRSVRSRWQAITTWLNWCVEWELIDLSPALHIKAPKVPKTRKPFLSEEQFAALLDQCPLDTLGGSRRQAMIWMLATSGIRRREMWSLAVEDLSWDASMIRVVHGKGQKERQIPFDRRCQRPMLRYLQHRTDTLQWLWVTEEGSRLAYDSIWQDLNRLEERAGFKLKDTCHIFRRTFAAHAVKQNIPRPYVQAIAGWSTPQMLDYYVAAMEAEEGAIEAFREFKPFGR
jgi:integrase/recombinase XerD